MERASWLVLSAILGTLGWQALGSELGPAWELDGLNEGSTLDWDLRTGVITAVDGFVFRHRDTEHGEASLQANRATLDQISGDVVAEGDVVLQRDGYLWRGEQLQYNFLNRTIAAENYRTGKHPFFAAGAGLIGDNRTDLYIAQEAMATSDDVETPFHTIRAKRLTIVPNEYFEARNATLYLGKVPVMYLPYFHRTFDRSEANHWSLSPGYRSRYGAYLHSTYDWNISTNLTTHLNLDLRSKRGVGGGPEFRYDFGELGTGYLDTYYTKDQDAGEDVRGKDINNDRYRIKFAHRVDIRTNLTAKVVVNKLSDAEFNRDFFESDHRRNTQPASYLELSQLYDNFSLNLLAQPRVNDFFERVERLPEIKLTAFRQQIGNTPLYYESESSGAYLEHRFMNNITNDYSAGRADTFHQIVLPQTYFGWLNFMPRAGGRYTYYSEAHGKMIDTLEERRFVFNTGAEVSLKASRVFPEAENDFFEVKGLRHIIQPSVNYVYVPEPDDLPGDLPQFDSEIPSLRLLPIEYTDYNSVESIDSQNVFRFGVRNKLQTKRGAGGQVDHLVNWMLFTDWRVDPRRDQDDFGDLNSDMDFSPRSWITLNSQVRYSLDRGEFRLTNHRLTLIPNTAWSATLGHLFIEDELDYWGVGNNVVYTSLYYRFNENWGARMNHHFEARDGRMEEQSYSLYRDFRSWTSAVSFRVREDRVDSTDYTIAVTFSLKAYPRYGLGEDSDRAERLFGG